MAQLDAYKLTGTKRNASVSTVLVAHKPKMQAYKSINYSLVGINKTLKSIEAIKLEGVQNDRLRERAERRAKRREQDRLAEQRAESNLKPKNLTKAKLKPKEKSAFEKIFGSLFSGLTGLFLKALKFFTVLVGMQVTKDVLTYIGKEENREKIATFFKKVDFIFRKIYGFTKWLVADNLLPGVTNLFGKDSDFGDRVKGLFQIMVGVAGLGALLNPFGLIDSILSLLGLDFYRDKTGEGPDKTRTTKQPPGKRTTTKQPTGSGRYRRTTPGGNQRAATGANYRDNLNRTAGANKPVTDSRGVRLQRENTGLSPRAINKAGDGTAANPGVRGPNRGRIFSSGPQGTTPMGPGRILNRTKIKLLGKGNITALKGIMSKAGNFVKAIPWFGVFLTTAFELLDFRENVTTTQQPDGTIIEESSYEPFINWDNLGRGVFKGLGFGLGSVIGAAVPPPIVGSIVGGFLGEYIGDLVYEFVFGGGGDAVGKRLKEDWLAAMTNLSKLGTWLKDGFTSWWESLPKVKVPKWLPFIGGMTVPRVDLILGNLVGTAGDIWNSFFGKKKGKGKVDVIPEDVTRNLPQAQFEDVPVYDENKKYKTGDAVIMDGKVRVFDGFGWAAPGEAIQKRLKNLTREDFETEQQFQDFKAGGGNAALKQGKSVAQVVVAGARIRIAKATKTLGTHQGTSTAEELARLEQNVASSGGFAVTGKYGEMRSTGMHKGVDLGTPVGTYISFTVDAEIVAVGTYGAYGLLVDAWLPDPGVQIRLAHLSKASVRSGDKILAGVEVGRTGGAVGSPGAGRSTGPHLHVEADTKRGGTRYGGSGNPTPYLKYVVLSSDPPQELIKVTPQKVGNKRGSGIQPGRSTTSSSTSSSSSSSSSSTGTVYRGPDGKPIQFPDLTAPPPVTPDPPARNQVPFDVFDGSMDSYDASSWLNNLSTSVFGDVAKKATDAADKNVLKTFGGTNKLDLRDLFPNNRGLNPYGPDGQKADMWTNSTGWQDKIPGFGDFSKKIDYSPIGTVKTSGLDFSKAFGFSKGGWVGNNLKPYLFGFVKKIFKGISKAVSSVVKGVGNFLSSPVGNLLTTVAGIVFPPLAPIIAGVKAVTALASGDIIGAITNTVGALTGFFPETMNNFFGGITNTFGEGMGGVINGFLKGGIGGAIGGLGGLLPEGIQQFFGGIGKFIEKNPTVGAIIKSIPGVANIPGLSNLFGLEEFPGMPGVIGIARTLAGQMGMGPLFDVLTGIGGLNPMSAMGQMAGELGVDQRVFGIFNQNDFGVFDSAAGMSSEYAMQTALEFVPIPILIMKLVPIDRPVPINNIQYVPQPAKPQPQKK